MNKTKVASILAWSLGVSILTSKSLLYRVDLGAKSGKKWVLDWSSVCQIVGKTAGFSCGMFAVYALLDRFDSFEEKILAKLATVDDHLCMLHENRHLLRSWIWKNTN